MYEQRESSSPLIRCVWQVDVDADGVWQDVADEYWGLFFGHHGDEPVHADAERAFLDAGEEWALGASYFSVQAEQPTTLCTALADSPVGLAAWLLDTFRAWSDREPDLDEVLTHISLYWSTDCIRSSMRL